MSDFYGKFPIVLEDDQTDRIGLRTLIRSVEWRTSKAEPTQAELDAETPDAPVMPGGMILIGTQTRQVGPRMRIRWTWEGIRGDGKGVTFKTRQNTPDWRFEPGFEQLDIRLHPKVQTWIEKWGGYLLDGDLEFPPTVSDGTGSGSGIGGKTTGGTTSNPFWGRKTVFDVQGTYLCRYGSLQPPQDSGVGKIHASGALPGRPPSYAGRNWLKLPSPFVGRGVFFDITEIYWLSQIGGWPREIYGSGGSGNNGTSSKSTGVGPSGGIFDDLRSTL